MFTWKKIGRIFNPLEVSGRSWLKEFAQAPSVIIHPDFVRVYFSCRPPSDANGQYVSYSAYVDFNRNNLTEILRVSEQPILTLGKRGTFDEFGTYPVSVIKHHDKYLCYYGGWTRCESVPFNVAIGVATSTDDGMTFRKMGDGPILSYSPDEPFILSGPKIRKYNNTFYLFYIAGKRWLPNDGRPEPVYKIRAATSDDGFHWKKWNRDLIADVLDADEAQASPDVFFMHNKYHMFFSYRHGLGFRSKEKGYRMGYASSDDLIHWTRDDSQAGIDVSEEGWDAQMISYPHVFELDGKYYMLYLGNDVGKQGFGMAELINYSNK